MVWVLHPAPWVDEIDSQIVSVLVPAVGAAVLLGRRGREEKGYCLVWFLLFRLDSG